MVPGADFWWDGRVTPSPSVRWTSRAMVRLVVAGLVAVLGLSTLLVLGSAGPANARADACGFVDLGDDAAVQARAEETAAVFYVRLREPVAADATTPEDRADWQVRVIDGLTGDAAPASRLVRFDISMVANTRVLTAGNDLVLFADDPVDQPATGDVFDVDLCTGVGVPTGGALSLDERAALTAVLEEGAAEEEPEPEMPTVRYSDVDDRSVDLGRSIAPGAALVLVGFLGLVLVSWAGRQRH